MTFELGSVTSEGDVRAELARLAAYTDTLSSDRLQEELPTVQSNDTATISATTWRPIFVALAATRVRDVALLSAGGHVGDSGANAWSARLATSRYVDGHPTTVAGGLLTIAQRSLANTNSSANAIDASKPWGWGNEPWTESAAYLQPYDVLGVLWEKTGTPSNIPTPLLFSTRLEPVAVA